jgi:hypothetical protein
VLCRGGSDDHAAIIANLTAAFHAAVRTGPCVVRGSDRQLVPRDRENKDLGSEHGRERPRCRARTIPPGGWCRAKRSGAAKSTNSGP